MMTPLLTIEELNVEFATRSGAVRVLRDVSFNVGAGETLALVGESGCGKSMTALSIMGLLPRPNGRILSGSIKLEGEELVGAPDAALTRMRGDKVSMIFQEPMTALNPVFTVGDQIAEVLRIHRGLARREALDRAREAMAAVDIPDPQRRLRQYPHELSGGMRQRIMIAMAIACEPLLLIADEPTTALDVTVQAQIFDLLKELQARTGMALILITHDMGAVAEMADRAIVMYAGRAVESAPVDILLGAPMHPYTRGLIGCIPDIDEADPDAPLTEIPGMVPALSDLSAGCAFAERCALADAVCRSRIPALTAQASDHLVACWKA
jgi:oligopeptide/dipeptide ABC transporter ATP-binding protein